MSVEDSTAKLVFTIRNTIDKLTDLWDKVHMEKDSREKRIDFALDHVYDLLNQIVIYYILCKNESLKKFLNTLTKELRKVFIKKLKMFF